MAWSTPGFLPYKQTTPTLTLRLRPSVKSSLNYLSLALKLSLNYHPCIPIIPLAQEVSFLNQVFSTNNSPGLLFHVCSSPSIRGFSAFLCPTLSYRRLASSRCMLGPLTHWLSVGLDSGKQRKEIREWQEDSRWCISPGLSFALFPSCFPAGATYGFWLLWGHPPPLRQPSLGLG